MVAKSKYNSIETLISQALNDMDISHKEFITILDEKSRYEKMKEDIKDKNEYKKQEIVKFDSIKKKLDNIKKNFFFSPIYTNIRDNKKELL